MTYVNALGILEKNLFDDFFNDFPFYDYDKEMKNTEKKLYGRKASHDDENRYSRAE